MKKLLVIGSALAILFQAQVGSADHGKDWKALARISDKLEDAYDDVEEAAEGLGDEFEELADRNDCLTDTLQEYLNPTGSIIRHRSVMHLRLLREAIGSNFEQEINMLIARGHARCSQETVGEHSKEQLEKTGQGELPQGEQLPKQGEVIKGEGEQIHSECLGEIRQTMELPRGYARVRALLVEFDLYLTSLINSGKSRP
jgi:hypothetical protein